MIDTTFDPAAILAAVAIVCLLGGIAYAFNAARGKHD